MSEKIEFTPKERLMLANQFIILSKLSELGDTNEEIAEAGFQIDSRTSQTDAKEYYSRKARILLEGLEYNYYEIFNSVREEGINEDVSAEVHKIVEMFEYLNASLNLLNEEDRSELDYQVLFYDGFDHRENQDHYLYIHFLAEEAEDETRRELYSKYVFNSSSIDPLPRYRTLLSIYKRKVYEESANRSSLLSKTELQEMISAIK